MITFLLVKKRFKTKTWIADSSERTSSMLYFVGIMIEESSSRFAQPQEPDCPSPRTSGTVEPLCFFALKPLCASAEQEDGIRNFLFIIRRDH